jgi:hypothetical protein
MNVLGCSSVVERLAVNQDVGSSTLPSPADYIKEA